jgi:glycerol-3-phosphate dehydrogenase (NAD+)
LIKGCDITDNGFQLFSQLISDSLNIETSVLMGANVADNIAQEEFSEATIGFPRSSGSGQLWKTVFERAYFEVTPVPDVSGVELCGTLKNIVAVGAGFVDGMGWGPNTKAAIIRIGFGEMRRLARKFYPTVLDETFWESSGIADVIATCTGGRNRKCAAAFAESVVKGKPKTWAQLENELLGGQKLQGVLTSFEVQEILRRKGIEADFPLFTTIYKISKLELPPGEIIRYREQGSGSSGQMVLA